jgi:hypothetical protein
LLELRLDFRVKVFETLPAMADHRRAKRLESFLADFDRSRNVQFDVWHKIKQFVKFFTSAWKRQAKFYHQDTKAPKNDIFTSLLDRNFQ